MERPTVVYISGRKMMQTTVCRGHSLPLPSQSTTQNSKTTVPEKKKKKPIPVALKRKVWSKWVGEDIGKAKCMCCQLTDITQLSFHCGHIIAEAMGGELKVDNLKPICQSCNSSMGTTNMNEFIQKYGF
jgi:5-methylcytosine-specific restriction endonuclease McrA